MTTPENVSRLNTLLEALPARDREILEGATATIIGVVKTNGSLGLVAMLIASSKVIEELKAAVVRSELGEAVLAIHTPAVES